MGFVDYLRMVLGWHSKPDAATAGFVDYLRMALGWKSKPFMGTMIGRWANVIECKSANARIECQSANQRIECQSSNKRIDT